MFYHHSRGVRLRAAGVSRATVSGIERGYRRGAEGMRNGQAGFAAHTLPADVLPWEAMGEPSEGDDLGKDAAGAKEHRAYLIEMYKLYHGHINTMFNYFIILSGLIANACIISLQQRAAINKLIPASIGIFGFIISSVSLLVHRRSRELIDLIEKGLEQEENSLFGINRGFLNVHVPRLWLSRHRYQFHIIYFDLWADFCS